MKFTRKELMEHASYIYNNYRTVNGETRLNHCSAWYVETADYYVLRSYHTIVAIYDKNTGMYVEFDYYSSTTSQHTHKFFRFLRNMYPDMDMEYLQLWKRKNPITYYDADGYVETQNFDSHQWKNILEKDFYMWLLGFTVDETI